jgi:hypothetical protein
MWAQEEEKDNTNASESELLGIKSEKIKICTIHFFE